MMQGNAILHWASFFLIFAVAHTENFSVRISSLVGTVVRTEWSFTVGIGREVDRGSIWLIMRR